MRDYQSMSDKWKTVNKNKKGESCGSSGGDAAGVRVKQLLFKSDTVSGVCLAAVP